MSIFQKLIITLCIAGASSCFTLFIYREITHKEITVFEDQDDSDFDYNELSFQESDETFTWEIIEKDGETFVVIDEDFSSREVGCLENSDEDFYEETENVTDPSRTCYVYKYPKKLIHLI